MPQRRNTLFFFRPSFIAILKLLLSGLSDARSSPTATLPPAGAAAARPRRLTRYCNAVICLRVCLVLAGSHYLKLPVYYEAAVNASLIIGPILFRLQMKKNIIEPAPSCAVLRARCSLLGH